MLFDFDLIFHLAAYNHVGDSFKHVHENVSSNLISTINLLNNGPKFYKLIQKFKQLTQCPLLINTSFNVRGEPIVCSPKNAIECFMSTNLDALVIENYFILKNQQDKKLKNMYIREFESD